MQWYHADGWDPPVGLDDAECLLGDACGCSGLTGGGGTRWDLLELQPSTSPDQNHSEEALPPRASSSGGLCQPARKRCEGKPKDVLLSRKQEESELLFFFLFYYLILRESFVDLGREGF